MYTLFFLLLSIHVFTICWILRRQLLFLLAYLSIFRVASFQIYVVFTRLLKLVHKTTRSYLTEEMENVYAQTMLSLERARDFERELQELDMQEQQEHEQEGDLIQLNEENVQQGHLQVDKVHRKKTSIFLDNSQLMDAIFKDR